MMMRGNNTVSFAQEEIFKIGSVLQKLIQMIPNDKENKEIRGQLVEAENIVSKGINKNKNLKGASMSMLGPSVMFNHYYGIENLCKKFGLG